MKKILLRALFAIGLLSSIQSINAQCSLDQVGIASYSTTSQYSDMAVAPDGTLYAISYNSGVGKFFLHSSFNFSPWTAVTSINATTSTNPVLEISKTGKVYVLLKDDMAGQVAKLFYLSGATFIQVGSAISGTNKASDLSLAINSLGEEYVAYTDITNSNRSTVKKWNGSAWNLVGVGPVSSGDAYYNSLIIDKTDTPILVFQDGSTGNKANVQKFNGTSWSAIDLLGSSVTNTKLKLGQNGDYYLGYTEAANTVVVQRYNGTLFSGLGAAVNALSPNAFAFDLELDPNDVPYFIALNNTSYYAVSYKYNGSAWVNTVGGNISAITSLNAKITIDNSGNPYFFYIDQPANYGINVKTLTSPISISSQPTSITNCNGQTGTFAVGTVGGVPTSYQWQTLGAGTYTNSSAPYNNTNTSTLGFTAVTGMNLNQVRCVVNVGCKNIISKTATLTVTTMSVNFTSTNPTCAGSCDGVINSAPSGGAAPYNFSWTPGGSTTQNLTGACAGTYTLNTSDINGCTANFVSSIINPTPISSSFSGSMTICNTSSTTLTITATGGTGPLTYVWSPGGSLSTTTGSIVTANPSSTQTYNVQITDANACVVTNTVMVNVNPLPTVTPAANVTICQGSSANIFASGTAHTYTWNPGNLIGPSAMVSPMATTIYTIVGTNTLTGCTNTANQTVFVNPLPTANAGPSRTLTCANTSTTLAGSTVGGVTYNWSGPGIVSGASTLSPTINMSGIYSLNVISSQGCNSTASSVSVLQNTTAPSPTATNSGTLTCSTTTVALIGGPSTGVTYQWTGPGFVGGTTSQNAIANTAGAYSLKVTDAINGCTNTAVTSVIQNTMAPLPTANNTGTLTCLTSTVSLAGGPATGVTYQWSGPGFIGGTTSQNAIANTAGTYSLKVTDAINGCTNTAVTSVIQNTIAPLPTASNTGTLTCSTSTVALTGGPSTGVTYQWNGPGFVGGTTSQNALANTAGSYSLIVTSTVNGCTNTAVTSVIQNTIAPSPTATNSGTLTCSTTTVALTGGPGTGVTYQWSGPGFVGGTTSQNAIANAAGTYSLKVSSSVNGCTNTAVTSVTQNTTAPLPTATNTGTLTCLTTTVALTGGPGTGVTYQWSGPGFVGGTTSQNAVANAAGTYSLKVTSSVNGCTNTAVTSVAQNTTTPLPTATNSGTITCSTSSVTLIGGPGTGVTYSWSGPGFVGGTTSQNADANAAGTFSLKVTSSVNGCTNTAVTSVTQNTVIPSGISAGSNQTITCASPSVSLNGSVTSPTNAIINWSGGVCGSLTSATTSACSPGTYSMTATDPINGCSNSSSVQVFANASVPSVTVSTSGTLSCIATTISATASTTLSTADFSWTGPNVVSGSTNSTAIIDQPGTYTVVITNTLSGCSTTITTTASSNTTTPVPSANSPQPIICSGNSTTLTANVDPNTDYTWNPGSLNGAVQNVSPSTSTVFSVVATNTISGCAITETVNITVNTTPTIAITGNINICNGSSTTLTGSGVTSYTWDTGANTPSISVTPTITTTYTLNGDNGNGCSSSLPVTVSIIPNKSITGVITSTAGATGGDVNIYKYTAALSNWNLLTTTSIGGTYSFNNLDSGLYVIRAIPTATNIQVTYAPNSISWQGATVINHGCTSNTSQNIDLIGLASFVAGPGVITGQIVEAFGFVPKMNQAAQPLVPGTPIGGIIVKGGKNPGGQMFVQTTTDAAGNYTLTGFPINTLPDDYFIFVDIPGLDTNSTYYHISITSADSIINGLDFNVDAEYINPIGSVTGISNDNAVVDNKIVLFPNPAQQNAYIQYELTKSANVTIELYDILGNKVKTISDNNYEDQNKHSHSINIEHLSSGIYFVKLKINNSITTIKLVINQ
jgi:hypothetical protein